MTGRDPQVQAAMDAAARELARRLEPYVPDANRHLLAAEFIEWEHAHGLRFIPSPDTPNSGHRPAPPNDTYRRARAALEGDRDG